jgi:hypothetical protein
MDNNRDWSIAVGDVRWWRGEMTAQSSTLNALLALAASRHIPEGSKDARPPNFREIVRGWDQTRKPTRREWQAATTWMDVTDRMPSTDRALCERLNAAWHEWEA